MSGIVIEFFSGIVKNPYLLSALLAVIPVTEIKGSVLFAAASGCPLFTTFLCGYGASLLLAIALSLLFPHLVALAERSKKVNKWLSLLSDRLEKKAEKIRGEKELHAKERALFGVYLFVALPLPLTGVWAGALLAAILKLSPARSVFSLATGNLTAGGSVLLISLLAGPRADLIFNLFLLLAAILITVTMIKSIIAKKKRSKEIE